MKVAVIIVAAGQGTRMGSDLPKQFLKLGGRSILTRTLERFASALPTAKLIVVLSDNMRALWSEIQREEQCQVEHTVCSGGAQRFFSVRNALEVVGDAELIAVHDAVRPLLSEEMILRVVECARGKGAVVPVVDAVDSFRMIQGDGSSALRREDLRAVQTPQIFDAKTLCDAYGVEFSDEFTDDASVVEKFGKKIYLCPGETTNIKITRAIDIKIAELILEQNGEL